MGTESLKPSVSDEISRIVASAKSNGECIFASVSAAWLIRIYPDCGLTERELTDAIILAASKAGVAAEMGRMAPDDLRSPVR